LVADRTPNPTSLLHAPIHVSLFKKFKWWPFKLTWMQTNVVCVLHVCA
jgi:hypothetical protein